MKHKFISLTLVLSMLYTVVFAQPVIRQQRTIGGDFTDYCTSIFLTKDGGIIAGGYSPSNISDEKTENSRGANDYWIVKLDHSGNIQWNKTIGGNRDDYLYTLQQTSDKGYILGGSSLSDKWGEKTEDSRSDGYYDYWVVKTDSLGNIQWDKTSGGNNHDELKSLQQTSDGGYILGGYSYSNTSFEKSENSRGLNDYWLVKLDRSGNIQWDKTIGGDFYDNLQSLQQTIDGGYILGGYSTSNKSGEKTEDNRGGGYSESDYWIVKLNSTGSIEWDKTIGGSVNDALFSIRQTKDTDFILAGYSRSNKSGEKSQDSRGVDDYWVVKLDNSGNIQWDKTIGGNSYDYLYAVEQTADRGYILGGYSSSGISGEKTENIRGDNFRTDYWVVKLRGDGKIQWDKTIGGSNEDYLYSIKEIQKSHYVLGGASFSGKNFDKTQANRGNGFGADYWLVELRYIRHDSIAVTSLSNTNNIKASETNTTNHFTIYPNPAKDILHIQTNGEATITLTNQSGKVLLTKTINNKGEINVAHLAAGLYYLKNNTTGAVQKVIVSK